MNPLPSKKLIPKTAKDLELPEEMVALMIEFYWKVIHDNLSSLTIPSLMIPKLGTFRVKHWKLQKEKDRLSRFVKSDYIPKTFIDMGRYNTNTTQIKKLEVLIKHFDKEKERKQEVKDKRNGKLPNKNLEK